MKVSWTSERGHLVARDRSGLQLRAWAADPVTLQYLPDLFNHFQDLSRTILLACQMPGQGTQRIEDQEALPAKQIGT